MTQVDVTAVYRGSTLHDYPEYDAEYHVDDPESPTTVTIHPASRVGDLATEWISCDIDHAIPMECIR